LYRVCMTVRRLLVLGMGLAIVASACGVQDPGGGGSPSSGLADADADPDTSGTVPLVDSIKPSVPSGTSSGDIMTASSAIKDLATRRGVPLDAVVLVAEQQVTWPSGALGCPRAGMSYTQALVAGGRIVLSVDDVSFFYHSGRTGAFFYCENPLSASPEHPDA
jgi:hypothetical protein